MQQPVLHTLVLRPRAPCLPPAPLPQELPWLSRTLRCPDQDMGQLCKGGGTSMSSQSPSGSCRERGPTRHPHAPEHCTSLWHGVRDTLGKVMGNSKGPGMVRAHRGSCTALRRS